MDLSDHKLYLLTFLNFSVVQSTAEFPYALYMCPFLYIPVKKINFLKVFVKNITFNIVNQIYIIKFMFLFFVIQNKVVNFCFSQLCLC